MSEKIWKAWISAPKPDPRVAELEARIEELEEEIRGAQDEISLGRTARAEGALEEDRLRREKTRLEQNLERVNNSYVASQRAHGEALQRCQVAEQELERLRPIVARYEQEQAERRRCLEEQATHARGTRFALLEVD